MKGIAYVLLALLAAPPVAVRAEPVLRAIGWEPRSDWINVRKDVDPPAVGDGVADDTVAIQRAIDAFGVGPAARHTVYLPPGMYRITRTLAAHKTDGLTVIGHGRATRIVWDGPAGTGDDSRMFWSEGAPRSRYVGLTWDGNHRAHVGFDHDSHSLFETEIDHEHEAFLHFRGHGLRVGHDQARPGSQAAAETTITNCLFQDCEQGVSILTFNDYNFTLAGCEFLACGTAIYGGKGSNFYVRDTHFEKSRTLDVRVQAEHSCSVRRCTSRGSRRFVEQNSIAPLTIQDCRVAGWSDPAGAVTLGGGPVLVFDTVFGDPPAPHPPIVPGNGQQVVLSNNRSEGTSALVPMDAGTRVTEVPAGALGGQLTSADQRFFREAPLPARRIFDARRDFGAQGDGKTDDTAAIQATLDAARTQGGGAIAYLPAGDYVVRETLRVTGADHHFAGSGIHSRLFWQGPPNGVLAHVHDPRDVTIENLDIGASGDQKNARDVLQTGSGTAASIRYDRVWVFGMYRKEPSRKGIEFRDLPAGTRVRGDHVNGNLRFTHSARARFLFNASYEGAILVEGRAGPDSDGLLGFQTRLATINTHGLDVRDSRSLVMSDYYVESADRLMEFSGQHDDLPGRVTIQMAKSHCSQNPVIAVHDYHGQIVLGPSMFYPGGIHPARIVQQGANRLTFVLMATQAYEVTPSPELAPGTMLLLVGNTGRGMTNSDSAVADLRPIAAALDDLRRLGALDLEVNGLESTAPAR